MYLRGDILFAVRMNSTGPKLSLEERQDSEYQEYLEGIGSRLASYRSVSTGKDH